MKWELKGDKGKDVPTYLTVIELTIQPQYYKCYILRVIDKFRLIWDPHPTPYRNLPSVKTSDFSEHLGHCIKSAGESRNL